MVKFVVRSCRMIRRSLVTAELVIMRFIERHRIIIQQIVHPLCAILLLVIVGLFCVYELVYILPEICDTSKIYFKLHCLLAFFYVYNMLGNMFNCWRTDTSFVALANESLHPSASEAHLWHLCTHCQMLVPPRAWHCRVCNCCILKRDHHCIFTANCIGHANQRYFVALLFHFTLGSCTALVYNTVHLFRNGFLFLTDPVLLTGNFWLNHETPDGFAQYSPWLIMLTLIIKLNVLACAIAGAHFGFHLFMISRGSCMYAFRDTSYDLGFYRNLQQVLGKRMFWTLIMPFLDSPLPQDGSKWLQAVDRSVKKPA